MSAYKRRCFGKLQWSVGSMCSWSITVAFPNAAPHVGCRKRNGWVGLMERIDCRAGHTQIGKVIAHAKRENQNVSVQAMVFVGDAMEERPGELCDAAAGLNVPVFVFQEGDDVDVKRVFEKIARLTRGAYSSFDTGAASQLRALLRSVAAYAAGGILALENLSHRDKGAARLLAQLK